MVVRKGIPSIMNFIAQFNELLKLNIKSRSHSARGHAAKAMGLSARAELVLFMFERGTLTPAELLERHIGLTDLIEAAPKAGIPSELIPPPELAAAFSTLGYALDYAPGEVTSIG